MTKDTEALRDDQWSDANMLRSIARDVDRWPSNATCDGAPTSADTLREIADRLDAALATPASDVAPVGDYHVTAAQYEAAVKGRQDFRQAYREQLELLSQKEWAAVAQIGADQELSTSAVLRQAVRLYQMHLYRLKAGETLSWSGDEQRAKDFAGPLYAHPPHPAPLDPVAGGEAWTCAARKQGSAGGNDPADCDWPFCGCDPYADKVLAVVEESALAALKGPAA